MNYYGKIYVKIRENSGAGVIGATEILLQKLALCEKKCYK